MFCSKSIFSFIRPTHAQEKTNDRRMNLTTLSQSVKRCTVLAGTSVTIVQFDSNGYIINQVIVCFLNCLLAIATVFLNGIAIRTLSKCFRLNEKICYFVISLQSAIDLMAGAVSIPLFTFVLASEIAGTANCVLNFILSTVAFSPMALSLAMLCALSFERYMGVLHPLVHRTKVTKKRFLGYLCIVIFIIFAMMLVSLVYPTLYFALVSINIFISLILVTFFYTRIFLAARQRFRLQNRPGAVVGELNSSERKKKRQFIAEFKLAKSCFLLVVTFVLCFVPSFIISVLSVIVTPEMVPRFRLFQSWAITLALFNHSLNSVIFFWTRPMLKKEARKVLNSMCGNQRNMKIAI